jgi:hypothetical protein
VEPYAPPSAADPFATSTVLFHTLVTELKDPAAAGLTCTELEELLEERGREVLRQLLQDHLDARAAREQEAAGRQPACPVGADGLPRTRLETGHCRLLGTLFGTVTVARCAWCRGTS